MSDAESDRPLEERLADHLAGEMSEPERARFEALLAQDAQLREEADSLAALAAQLTRLPAEAWTLAGSARVAPRRRATRMRLAVVLAALSLVAFAAGVGAGVLIERPAAVHGRLVALRALLPAYAHARVLTGLQGSGRLELVYRSMPSPGPGRYYEAWLMTSQTQLVALVSFRPPPGGSGKLVTDLPAPAAAYRYVDISLQRVGAGPQHSAVSVLRGPTAPLLGRG
ncbi:MAG TPA: anti-sigma factor [Solirubrobacteraceae bacterium]|nr:anti-sigma factor [Solirubrobacteraceae bacterium]